MFEARHAREPFLPLSWSVRAQAPHFQAISLPLSAYRWLAFGDLPADYSLAQVAGELKAQQRISPYVVRGCHSSLVEALQSGEAILTGREALLDLSQAHMRRKSIKELARRGRRHGQVRELSMAELESSEALQALFARVHQNYQVPLSYLYRNHLPQSERYWAMIHKRAWGLVSLIPNGPGSWHTELLMRDPEAPVGVMEALVASIFEQLRQEGAHYWSLGEVPFYTPSPPQTRRGKLVQWVGREIDYAYSSQGLYHFKHKFRPLWRPVYLYGWPKLNLHTLATMFWKCNCYQLVLYKSLKHLSAQIGVRR